MGLAQDRLAAFSTTILQLRIDLSARVDDTARDQLFNHIVYQQLIEQVDNMLLMIDIELSSKEANIKEIRYEDIKSPVRDRVIIPTDVRLVESTPIEGGRV